MSITRENLQSRLRGVMLMGLSNALGGIVLSTGNKSEMSVGYATLYGDMNGGFNPIKSVYKSDVFAMCRMRNALPGLEDVDGFIRDPIPEKIISRPPSAELAQGQVDTDSLGDYALLDLTLRSLIEDREGILSVARIIQDTYPDKSYLPLSGGLSPANYAAKIARMVRGAQFKRDQAPPGVKLNGTDFGLGWRYPIAGHYQL
jgi:NAD+ synthetase